MYRKYLFICSGYYMSPELFEPFKLSNLSKHSNSSNKLNTLKVSGCPGSYMSWWVIKIEFKGFKCVRGVWHSNTSNCSNCPNWLGGNKIGQKRQTYSTRQA